MVALVALVPWACWGQASQAAPASEALDRSLLCGQPPSEQTKVLAFPVAEPMPPHGVVVRVQMAFADLSGEPAVQVVYNSGSRAFADVVVASVKAYRLGCLTGEKAPSSFAREYQFVPGEIPKVVTGAFVRLKAREQSAAECLKGGEKPPWPPLPSPSPSAAFAKADRLEPGYVIVRLTFSRPDEPPSTEVLFSGSGRRFEATVRAHVNGYRLPCHDPAGKPLVATQVFHYVYEGEQTIASPISLQQWLSVADNVTARRVRFDFTTMSCPFDVRLTYLQPYMPSSVEDQTRSDPNKQAFADWLGGLTIKPALSAGNKLIGRLFNVSVPCLVLDLS